MKQNPETIRQWYLAFEKMINTTPQLAQLATFFNWGDSEREDIIKLHEAHYSLRVNQFLNQSFIDVFTKCIDAFQQHSLSIPKINGDEPVFLQDTLTNIDEMGYSALPPLPASIASDMLDYFKSNDLEAGKDKTQKPINEISKTDHIGTYSERTVANCPHFLEYLLSPEILHIVEKRIGATPSLTSLTSWWSFAENQKAKEAQNFHLDFDDYRFVKLFIYLTDVDEKSGPHTYVPRTHNRIFIRNLLNERELTHSDIRSWYFQNLRKSDEEVSHYLNIEPVSLTGRAGSCFLVDTSGIHKGLLPETNDRLIVQATFGCTPCKTTRMNPLVLGEENTNNIHPDILTPPNDYIARLFVGV